MKKFFTITVPIALAAILVLQFTSCEKYVLPELALGTDTLFFSASADSSEVAVESNVIWQASLENSGDDWLETGPSWFEGPGEAYVKVQENVSGSQRSANVVVKSETITKKIFVIQQTPSQDEIQ